MGQVCRKVSLAAPTVSDAHLRACHSKQAVWFEPSTVNGPYLHQFHGIPPSSRLLLSKKINHQMRTWIVQLDECTTPHVRSNTRGGVTLLRRSHASLHAAPKSCICPSLGCDVGATVKSLSAVKALRNGVNWPKRNVFLHGRWGCRSFERRIFRRPLTRAPLKTWKYAKSE